MQFIHDVVWSPFLVILLVGAGLFFSIRTRFFQIRRIGLMARLMFARKADDTNIGFSSFQAFCVALSGRVGTGNIVGVATAIATGGPGAVFWMWVIAFLGAATAFTESTLAQIYRFPYNGEYRGGPSSYIEKGLKIKWMGIAFSVAVILGYGIFLLLIQSNSISTALNNSFNIPYWLSGLIIAFCMGLVLHGGIERISRVASSLVPFMALAYLLVALVIIVMKIDRIPGVFSLIFSSAFGINPLTGGLLGSAIATGVKRGLFSNEAGQGGGAIVSASALTDMPAQQGLVQGFSVYVDTLFVCTATALVILCTDSYNIFDPQTGAMIFSGAPELGKNYVSYAQNAINSVIPGLGNNFLPLAIWMFAFTTMMAYYYYAESSLIYIFSKKESLSKKQARAIVHTYRLIFLIMVFLGSVSTADKAWLFGDIGLGLTTWINVAALLFLFPQALSALNDIEKKYPARKCK